MTQLYPIGLACLRPWVWSLALPIPTLERKEWEEGNTGGHPSLLVSMA